MMNSVHSIISLEQKSYRNKVSMYVFKYPGTKFHQQKETDFLASDKNLYRCDFFADEVITDKVCQKFQYKRYRRRHKQDSNIRCICVKTLVLKC